MCLPRGGRVHAVVGQHGSEWLVMWVSGQSVARFPWVSFIAVASDSSCCWSQEVARPSVVNLVSV